jgi:microcystin-dependent protein
MADTATPLLQLTDQETGNNDNTWGDILDANLLRIENAIAGVTQKAVTGGSVTLTDTEALSAVIVLTGVLASYADVSVPARTKKYTVVNDTTGPYAVYFKTPAGWGFWLPRGKPRDCFCDGINVRPIDGAGSVPIGGILHLGVTPTYDDADYLTANGSAVSRTEFAQLYAKIGTTWGVGDGSTTFNLPNLTDRYLRGSSGYVVGTYLASELASHTHTATAWSDVQGAHTHGGSSSTSTGGSHEHSYVKINNISDSGRGTGGSDAITSISTETVNTSTSGSHNHTYTIVSDGSHNHNIYPTVNATGGSETRPASAVAVGIIRFQ